jgi:hypothetical protein
MNCEYRPDYWQEKVLLIISINELTKIVKNFGELTNEKSKIINKLHKKLPTLN